MVIEMEINGKHVDITPIDCIICKGKKIYGFRTDRRCKKGVCENCVQLLSISKQLGIGVKISH